MRDIGELHIIESKDGISRIPERSIEIDSPEALMQYGEEVRERVRIRAIAVKGDTSAELNDVCAATALPKETVYILRREFDIDGKIQQSFGKVDELAATTEQEISATTTVH